jgi:hypothetical protein
VINHTILWVTTFASFSLSQKNKHSFIASLFGLPLLSPLCYLAQLIVLLFRRAVQAPFHQTIVRIGDYTLEFVEAESKIALKEHAGPAPDHFVYAEVEPDVGYFIRIESDNPEMKRIGVKVDGVALYDIFVTKGQSRLNGFFKRVNKKSTTTALHFEKSTMNSSMGKGPSPTIWTGKVEIDIYEIGRPIVKEIKDMTTATLKQSMVSGKKGVASAKGSCIGKEPTVENPTNTGISYERGPRVCTITLHYCTTAGYRVFVPPPAEPVAETKKAIKREKKRKIGEASGSSEDPIEL